MRGNNKKRRNMMEISEEEIRTVLMQVKHPAIDCNLVDLGIVKNLKVKGDIVCVTIAFPFPNIPIKEYLIQSVKIPIEKLGAQVEMEETVMNQEELQEFLAMEKENWRGV
jgi:metal-sulfur cluster biosynthetic enzyme